MATIDELQVLISANSAQFQAEMKKVQREMAKVNSSVQASAAPMKGLSVAGMAAATILGNAFSKVVGIITENLGNAVERVDALNNFPKVMSNLGISAEESQKSIGFLSEKLRGLPTSLNDAALSVQRFTSANGNINASTHMFLALNNAILAGGASADIQKTALEQLSQSYAKGKPDMMEWRSAVTAMPAQLKQVAGAMGFVSADALGESLRDGKTSMNEFMSKIVELNQHGTAGFASFEEQARNSTGGIGTSLANLRNAITRAIGDILNVIGQANIAGFFNAISSAVNAVVPYIAGFVKVVMMAIGALRTLFGGGGGSPQKATADIKANLGGAGANAGNLANQAGGAGKKLGGAAKQAKKLAQQLASFDEMNTLKTPDVSNGGGGGGTGGGSSSGGAVNGAIPDFGKIDTAGLDNISKKAEEVANAIKKFFEGMFDFKKIGSAFKQFWDDIKATAKPVFEVISDAWERYLKPIISWAGNELLPAFLNAVGGAARFLGEMLKSAYEFSRPFIDAFIAPLVGFIGSGIVKFLNGIGDAFRAMSKDKGLVDFLTQITIVIGGMTVAIKAAEAISAFNAGVKTMQALALSSPQAIASMVSSLGSVKSAFVLAGGGMAGVKASAIALGASIKTSVIGAFNTIMAHPIILAIAGIAAGFAFLGGSIKSAFEQGNPAMWESESRTKALEKAQEKLKEATQKVKQAEEELNSSRASQADAQIAHTEAIKRKEEAQKMLNQTLLSLNISEMQKNEIIAKGNNNYAELDGKSRQVYDAYMQLESASVKVKTSQDAVNSANADAKTKEEEHKKALDDKKASLIANAISQDVINGKYKNSKDALEALKGKTIEYKDENGNMVKVSEEDISRLENTTKTKSQDIVKTYRDSKSGADQGFFGPMGRSLATAGDQLGKFAGWAGEKFGEFISWAKKAGSDAWHGITSFFGGIGQWFSERWGDIKNAFSNAWQAFSNIGRNIWEGLKSGIGNIANNMRNMFSGAVEGVKKFLGIHSPSRLFMGLGSYVGEGFAIGIDDEQKTVMNALKGLTSGFEAPKYTIRTDFSNIKAADLPDVSDLNRKIQQDFESSASLGDLGEKLDKLNDKPQQIIVKIGEDRLIDKLVDGINQNSFLRNGNVIDI